jgi:hypothetical protein
MIAEMLMTPRHHIALHLAHRWFAYLEAPGGDLETHLTMFHPQVRLSGHRGGRLFASDHQSLTDWFAAVPDEVSSHHIVHANFSMAEDDTGLLSMVVAYQALGDTGVHGSIIAYETRIEFAADAPRFIALDKTPILSNTRAGYDTSWSINRVLSLVHAELGGVIASDGRLRALLGADIQQVFAQSIGIEGSRTYEALVTSTCRDPLEIRAVRLELSDDVSRTFPGVESIEALPATSA